MTYLKAGIFTVAIQKTLSGFGWSASTPGYMGWQSETFYDTIEEAQENAREWLRKQLEEIEFTIDNVWQEN